MITAIDSSVILLILNQEPQKEAWQNALAQASLEGLLVICPVVFAECGTRFSSLTQFQNALDLLQISYDPFLEKTAFSAGQIFKHYRQSGGPRNHLIPDFLVAAHAENQCDRLAAVDRGYFRHYFPKLKLLQPLQK